jgi:DUF1365 family protein
MKTLNMQINKSRGNIFSVKMDKDRFEALAASLGFFSKDFLKSLKNAEGDHKAGRTRKIKSLKEII